jgi:hypothetical protein
MLNETGKHFQPNIQTHHFCPSPGWALTQGQPLWEQGGQAPSNWGLNRQRNNENIQKIMPVKVFDHGFGLSWLMRSNTHIITTLD